MSPGSCRHGVCSWWRRTGASAGDGSPSDSLRSLADHPTHLPWSSSHCPPTRTQHHRWALIWPLIAGPLLLPVVTPVVLPMVLPATVLPKVFPWPSGPPTVLPTVLPTMVLPKPSSVRCTHRSYAPGSAISECPNVQAPRVAAVVINAVGSSQRTCAEMV